MVRVPSLRILVQSPVIHIHKKASAVPRKATRERVDMTQTWGKAQRVYGKGKGYFKPYKFCEF